MGGREEEKEKEEGACPTFVTGSAAFQMDSKIPLAFTG